MGARAAVWSLGSLVPAWPCLAMLLLLLAGCYTPLGVLPPVELVVLGIAQDGGLPHFGCEQPCCVAARQQGRVLFPSALGLVDRRGGGEPRLLLVEATPRIEEQVALLHQVAGVQGRGRHPVDAVMTTHAHLGHFLGLLWFGREIAGSREVPLHASARFCEFLATNAPWRQLLALGQLQPHPFLPDAEFSPWPGLTVRAVAVPHRDEWSDTMAYILRGPTRSALFVPDVDAWHRAPGLLERLLADVDIAYLDGTFFDGRELPDRDLAEIPHPPITATMALLAEEARARPGRIRFLHCNHSNPVLHDAAVRKLVLDAGFGIAEQGERVTL